MIRALIFLCLIWGFNFVVMKTASNFFSPELFVAYRFSLGAAVLLAVVIYMKLPLPPKKFWSWIFLSGILQISFNCSIIQYCFKFLDAGLVSVLNYTMPVWVTILARFFLDEPLTRKKIFGVVLSVVGVAVLMNVEISGDIRAILLALSAAMFWAISNVIMKAKLTKCNAIALTTWQMTIGAISLVIYALLFGDTEVTWNLTAAACLLYNGILASALGFFVWIYVLDHMEAGKASIFLLGVPVVGVAGGVICLGEPITITMVMGILMVLVGIVLVQHT